MRSMPHLHRRSFLVAVGALALTAARLPSRVRANDAEPVAALLDGVLLPPEEAARVNAMLPVAVMVDNLPGGARPQIGLDRADLVYEMLVEGGITRFMAVYLRQDAAWVQPVRSVRTPFLYPARELDAVIAHVGAAATDGPADADTQMGRWGVRHLDEQYNPGPFWRVPGRVAPHNAATATNDVRAHAVGLGWEGPSDAQPWRFKDDLLLANPSAGEVDQISYGFALSLPAQADFTVAWRYDPSANAYRRAMAGRPHVDGLTGEILTAKNVVVQLDRAEIVDREGHVLYGSLGSGAAFVFLDGQVVEATWTKEVREQRTRYWDGAGTEVAFNRGSTWVSVVPVGSPVGWR